MRRLNVLPAEFGRTKRIWRPDDPVTLFGIWGCAALLAIVIIMNVTQYTWIFVYNRRYAQQKDAEQDVRYKLYEQRERIALIRSSLESLEEERTLLDQKLRHLLRNKQQGPFWSAVLVDLSQVLAEQTTLTNLDGSDHHIVFEGRAPDPRTINTLIASMSKLDRFRNVRLNFTEIAEDDDQSGYTFQIASDIR